MISEWGRKGLVVSGGYNSFVRYTMTGFVRGREVVVDAYERKREDFIMHGKVEDEKPSRAEVRILSTSVV
jgi:hypothetical protein